MSTTLATERDLDQMRQEIALLRTEVAGLRAEIGRLPQRGLGSPLHSLDKFNDDFSRTLASVTRRVTINVGLIFFTGCALMVALVLSWR